MRREEASTPAGLPADRLRAVDGRKRKAFTLVELLIVVGIIALLIALIMPSLGRARQLAMKTVCGAQMRSYSSAILLFVQDQGHYPHMGTGPRNAWPKFYGVLRSMRLEPPRKLRCETVSGPYWAWDYSPWEFDEVWEKSLCPAMDAAAIMRAADRIPHGQTLIHRASIGYQWNMTLRAAGAWTPVFPSGRWPLECAKLSSVLSQPGGWWDNTMWMPTSFELADGESYIAQAINPEEIEQPAEVAEAWDSWLHRGLVGGPGWHVGPWSRNWGGWAPLRGDRHPSGPNILYADGHCAADATHYPPNEDGTAQTHSATWTNFDEVFGTHTHIVPRRAFHSFSN